MKSYEEYVKDFIKDELYNNIGREVYGADLGFALTESINIDGSATYNIRKAEEYIKEWWDEAADVYNYQKMNYGECLHNPFESLEKFHVCMIIEGVNSILSQCKVVDENWNNEFEITEDVYNLIIEQMENLEIEL